MFRLVAYCEDKNLAKCLSALKGIASIPETPQEVINAKMNGSKPVPISNGEANELFKQWARKNHITEVRPLDLKRFCTEHNRSEASYSVLLTALIKAGILSKRARKSGNSRHYRVM